VTPVIAYASKAAIWACIYAGLLGESLARAAILGVDVTTIGSGVLGGMGLFLVGVRLRLDDKLLKREREVAFKEGYFKGREEREGPR